IKYVIDTRDDKSSKKIKQTMKSQLIYFNLTYDTKEPELVISVGGDGTFLEAFHRYIHRLDSTAFIGVHTGHLGFYTDWVPDEMENLIIEIVKISFDVNEINIYEMIMKYKNKFIYTIFIDMIYRTMIHVH